MSTRWAIALPDGDGFAYGRYVHSDGYPTCALDDVLSSVRASDLGHVTETLIMSKSGMAGYSTSGHLPEVRPYSLDDRDRWRTYLGRSGQERPIGRPDEDIGYHFSGTPSEDFLFIEWVYVLAPMGVFVFDSVDSGERGDAVSVNGRPYESYLYTPTLRGVVPWDADPTEVARMANAWELGEEVVA